MRDVERVLSAVRKDGMALAVGLVHPGVVGMSAPVFDADGKLVASLNLAGMDGTMDRRTQNSAARALRAAASSLSSQIGNASK